MKMLINNLNFFKFSFFNILEKFLAYVSPLLILKFIENPVLYNKIELIFSISIIINVFIDFGIKGHFVYSYRFYDSKKKHKDSYLKAYNILILYYLIFSVCFLWLFNFFGYNSLIIIFLTLVRVFYLLIINFYKFFFRFYYNINYYFLLTLPVNIFTILLIYFTFKFNINYLAIYFFLAQLILVCVYFLLIISKSLLETNIKNFLKVIKNSFVYYWPIILSSAVSLIIMNFGKIFSYFNLPENDMTKFSFIIRFLLIIQLFHATFSSYFLKKNYEENEKIINKNIILQYLIGLFIVVLIVNILFPISNDFFNSDYTFDKIYFLLMSYIVVWCVSSYLEQFLGKFNKNLYLMYLQIFSLIIYFTPIIFLKDISIYKISFLMLMSCSFYLLGIIYFLQRENIKLK